ncbi:MAG: rod shape-determining protein [Candidatus Colwellbacteria bacterium CG10_big_fil_rev_8_21_14_0_10_41_28]|uniref:Cell shape-determining protein MreB n=1 Tax=Candidatus Colwellbacteria bacterium CG10_big_fil_rev_8_21_14_0_10_41_28 TaxID=1974539 RepID=A0A2H0VH87_9BACT|nr:MAG: rod shape-determining protein [Candidatus Colwellbacteria bacterium CG10_big_fil_rev_8_21_14_0_10_41_28]
MKLLKNLYKSVGIDLGTTNFLVYLKNRGIVVDEPTLVAINNRTNQVLAIGEEAKKMLDRTPAHVRLVKPLSGGVISDFEVTEEIIKYFLRKISEKSLFSRFHVAAVSIPTNLTEVERKSVEDAVLSAGATKVLLVEEPIASAVGTRLPIEEATANMIVDIGGGTTEISIISVGGAVVSKSIKIAGNKFNEDIIRFIKNEYKLLIGEPTAENLKINVGSAIPIEDKLEMKVRGRDMSTGLPKEITVRDIQIRSAMQKSIKSIGETVKNILEESPPELVGDVLERGIFLSGGGALLRGMDKFLEKETQVDVTVVDDPLTCVVRGLGIIIEDIPRYETILSNQEKPKPINL